MMDKKRWRQILREQRNRLSTTEQQQAADKISATVLSLPAFIKGKKIGFYSAHDSEINPESILRAALEAGKACYLPVLGNKPREMQFCRYQTNDNLITNRFGIAEPDCSQQKTISANELDIVLLPVVACDNKGNRVGFGSGYYDHLFSFIRENNTAHPVLIGLAYDFQKVEEVPTASWDVAVHILVTNKQIYLFRG